MAITDEITRVIRERIQGFDGAATDATMTSVGTVLTVADGIARVYGLADVRYLELVEFTRTGLFGIAFNLEEDSVAVPILGDYTATARGRRGAHAPGASPRCRSATR